MVLMIRHLLIHSVLVTTLVLFAHAQPQTANRNPPPAEEQLFDENTEARYQLALSYLRGMQFDRAIAVFNELREEFPHSQIFFEKLKESYVNAKRYDDAIALIDHEISTRSSDEHDVLAAERAQLFYLDGHEPSAMNAWYDLVQSPSANENTYRIVYASMIRVRLLIQAIDLLLEGRTSIGNENLFQADIAYLYSLTGQHELAAHEYLNLLAFSDQQLNYVKGRLGRDLEQNGALAAAIEITQKRIESEPDLLQFRDLLAWLYEENGDFEQAYREISILEEQKENSGEITHQFALRAAEFGAFDVAGRAFQAVLASHPNETIYSEARLGLADMYRLIAEHDSKQHEYYSNALNAYKIFMAEFPDHPKIPTVMQRIAQLHQKIFLDRDAARAILLRLTTTYPLTPIAYEARFNLGQLAVEEGHLDQAIDIFSDLSNRAGGELSAHASYEKALIHFYKGDFELTQSLLSTLGKNADKETANDAIALRVLLLNHPPLDSTNSALQKYAGTLLLLRQHQLDKTIQAADEILFQWGQNPIADDTRFLRAQALEKSGHITEATMAFGEFPLIHPQSTLLDQSMFKYAELLESQGHISEALQSYNDFLLQYPSSLLARQVRERIRELRTASL